VKLPLGKLHLGNYPWEVAAWENVLGKVPKIKGNTISIIFLSHLILIIYKPPVLEAELGRSNHEFSI